MTSEKNTEPSISKTAFSCPHCGAYTTQHWYNLVADPLRGKNKSPFIPTDEMIKRISVDSEMSLEDRGHLVEWAKKIQSGKLILEESRESLYNRTNVINGTVSQCYNCDELTIWVHDCIVYPRSKIAIQPNNDLHDHIRALFEEAREIVGASPKGAAALLRLSIQHLCKELGQSGDNLDADIGALVGKGLDPLVQQALDIVRVIGNESVHPGEIDLNDDRDTAIKLFELVNLICEQMISHPKKIAALYAGLPPNKLQGIEQRNKKAKAKVVL